MLEILLVGDTMRKVVVHRHGWGRGVKHCGRVGQMELVGSLSAYLRQSQTTYSSLVQSIMWPCVSRLQIMVSVSGPCHGKTLGCLLLVQQRVEPLGEGRDEISKLVEEVETVKQKM